MRYICTSIVATLMLAGTTLGAIIYVPADYVTIQDAVDVAVNGDEIIVAPGIHVGSGDTVVDMLGKKIKLRSSGGAATTVIDGQGAAADSPAPVAKPATPSSLGSRSSTAGPRPSMTKAAASTAQPMHRPSSDSATSPRTLHGTALE